MSRIALAALAVLALATAGRIVTAGPPDAPDAGRSSEAIVQAADAFVELLGDAEREKATWSFEDDERFNWHFVPRARNGLPIAEMSAEQRAAAHALLQATTSSQGYNKAVGVMQLEGLLGELEGRPERRSPEAYFFWIFGTPSANEPWGWRFEGHHISLNFTSASGLTVATPSFMGANPARVPSGPFTGWRVLGSEEDGARALLASFTPAQAARAVISEEAPSDIITGADREVQLSEMSGLPASEMTPEQQHMLMQLVMEYVGNMDAAISAPQLEKIHAAGVENLHFAWAGSTERGEGHYYRIHGPTVLIEYDNTQGNANHVHSTWRDLTDDFGEDLLRRHYEEHEHEGGVAAGSG